MHIYRGMKKSGLKEMIPVVANHNKAYVYATSDKNEAIIYSVKGGNFNFTNIYGYDDDNKRCIIERVPNILEKIFSVEGRYYELDNTSFYRHIEEGVGDNEYVSEVNVKVIDEVTIPNVWQYFKELEKQNKLKIYRYPNRPKDYPTDDSDLLYCAELSYKQMGNTTMFDLLEKYHPELQGKIRQRKSLLLKGEIL